MRIRVVPGLLMASILLLILLAGCGYTGGVTAASPAPTSLPTYHPSNCDNPGQVEKLTISENKINDTSNPFGGPYSTGICFGFVLQNTGQTTCDVVVLLANSAAENDPLQSALVGVNALAPGQTRQINVAFSGTSWTQLEFASFLPGTHTLRAKLMFYIAK